MHPKIEALISKEYEAQRSDAWLALRGNMLTASDAATAIGVNPYEKPEGLILKKCGENTFFGNAATEHGNKYEDEARDIYCERHGEVTHEIGLYPHPTYDWLGGSPDGVTESGKLIEIKCPMRRSIVPGEVPGHYIPQIQLLMDILELEECDFIQYKPAEFNWPEPTEFDVVNVKRDRQWFAEQLPVMDRLWQRVLWHRENGIEGLKKKPRAKKRVVSVDMDVQARAHREVKCEIEDEGTF